MDGESTMIESEPRVSASDGNVFADLSFDDPELELAKARLTSLIDMLVQQTNASQHGIAKSAGLTATQFSNLLLGDLGDISIEQLLRILTALNQSVEIVVRPSMPATHAGPSPESLPMRLTVSSPSLVGG